MQPSEQAVRDAIHSQRYYTAFTQYTDSLRRKFPVKILLQEPKPMVQHIAAKDDPSTGSDTAAVVLVEFIDLQCPSCAELQTMLQKILKEFEGRVKLIVRDYPIRRHQFSEKAAEAAQCAHEQGKFWEYLEMLFQNQNSLDADNLRLYAGSLGLDATQFDLCLESGKFATEVNEDKEEGIKAGVRGTPTLFINGVKVWDLRYEAIRAAILGELTKGQGKEAKKATP